MKQLAILIMILALAVTGAQAQEPSEDILEDVVVQQLARTAQLFDAYVTAMGGTGAWHRIKTRFKSLFSTDPYAALEEYNTWAPAYMAKAKGMSAYDPYTENWLGKVLAFMPARNDTYASCRDKISKCVAFVFREKSPPYHQDVMTKIKTASGLDWL